MSVNGNETPVFKNQKKSTIAILSLIAILAVGDLDYLTGYKISLLVVYLLPIGFATIYVGPWYAASLAVLSIAISLCTDFWAGMPSFGGSFDALQCSHCPGCFCHRHYSASGVETQSASTPMRTESRTHFNQTMRGTVNIVKRKGSPSRQKRNKKGQTLVEYALILALISVVAISVLIRLGNQIKSTFSTITSQLAVAGSSH